MAHWTEEAAWRILRSLEDQGVLEIRFPATHTGGNPYRCAFFKLPTGHCPPVDSLAQSWGNLIQEALRDDEKERGKSPWRERLSHQIDRLPCMLHKVEDRLWQLSMWVKG